MRTNHSKRKLKEALLFFLKKKDLKEITVKSLCEYSQLNRSSFYDNYESIYDLMSDLYQDFFSEIAELISNDEIQNGLELYTIQKVIDYYAENKNLQFLLFSRNENHLFEANLIPYFMERFKRYSIDERYMMIYHLTGSLTIIKAWLLDQKPCSSLELANKIVRYNSK